MFTHSNVIAQKPKELNLLFGRKMIIYPRTNVFVCVFLRARQHQSKSNNRVA